LKVVIHYVECVINVSSWWSQAYRLECLFGVVEHFELEKQVSLKLIKADVTRQPNRSVYTCQCSFM